MKISPHFLRAITRVLTLSLLAVSSGTAAPRSSFNFNPGWRVWVGDDPAAQTVEFDDKAWKSVTLPYAWNEDSAFRVSINKMPTGVAWYRKTFRLPEGSAGRKVFLEFEGARQAAEIWLNGKQLGLHENGITAFGFDITDVAKPAPGDNILAVRTDNVYDYKERATRTAFQWNHTSFNVSYGGLPKNVRLHVTDKLYQTLPLHSFLGTTGVYVYAKEIDIPARAATVHVETEVRNEHAEPRTFELQVELKDPEGKVVKTFRSEAPVTIAPGATVVAKAAARVDGLNFWSWGYGYLYDVVSTLVVEGEPADAVVTRSGFRKTEFGRGMVMLNDRVIQMKGYAQRSSNEWPALGSAVPAWLSDYSNRLMVESGANLVRWMHVTPGKQDVESCDRVGLLQALPAGDAEHDTTGRQWEQRVEVMRDATIYNRNNPSVIFYEGGNETISEEHMAELKAIRDQYDPHGGRAAGSREMLSSKVAEWGGEMMYINKSARIPFWATEYSRDEGLRKYWDEFSPPFHKEGDGPLYRNAPAPTYNHNQDAHAIENIRRWFDYWRERPGTGTRVSSGGVNIIFSDSNTHSRGAENYRRSGEVDALRIPKDGFWAHQVMWNGWVDVEKPGIHIFGHWNYADGVKKDVFVVSSADEVELLRNGKSLGKGAQDYRFLYTFKDVAWEPGELRAVGFDASGKKLCEFAHVTAGAPAAVRLTPILRDPKAAFATGPVRLTADGADTALVEVEVVDDQGRRCPTALDLVEFTLDGPAEWRGGIAQGPDNYILSKTLPVECGVNRVLIRTKTEPGKIILSARSGSLKPATLELASEPCAVTSGLAGRFPADGLPAYLERGPTPGAPSFQPSRIAVPVAKVTAADAGESATLTIDDNEETSWIGRSALTFELSRPATLTEVAAKYVGWRARIYPIRITVDGQEVFRGNAPQSLGYITVPLKPVQGRTVEVALIGTAEAQEAFASVTELENKANAETGANKVPPDGLGIVEIEFYEAAASKEP